MTSKYDKYLDEVAALRKKLHENPEASEKEVKTRKILQDFLKEHTTLEIVDKGKWFYAIHKEEDAKETIAFRADFDAIISEDGQAFHGCGHDGHASMLAGFAWSLEGEKTGNNIVFLFQHAEENGAGAKEAVELFDEVDVDRIYGLHNIPGLPFRGIATKPGPVQCASKGMTIDLVGKQSHASEPENGVNPVYTIADVVNKVEPLHKFNGFGPIKTDDFDFKGLVLCTVVSTKVGEQGAFGVSPSRGRLEMTLRAVYDEDMDKLEKMIRDMVDTAAEERGMKVEYSFNDVFPDTVNDEGITKHFFELLDENGIDYIVMDNPVRASEDFGEYLKRKPGCYFYLGAGEDHEDLHTIQYEFPDGIITKGIEMFNLIARSSYKK